MDEFIRIPDGNSDTTELDYNELSDEWELISSEDEHEVASNKEELEADIRSGPDLTDQSLDLTDEELEQAELGDPEAISEGDSIEILDDPDMNPPEPKTVTGELSPIYVEEVNVDLSGTSDAYESDISLRIDQAVIDAVKAAHDLGVAEGVSTAANSFEWLYGRDIHELGVPTVYSQKACERQISRALQNLSLCRGLQVTRAAPSLWVCNSKDLMPHPLRDVAVQASPEMNNVAVQECPVMWEASIQCGHQPLLVDSGVQVSSRMKDKGVQPYFPPAPKMEMETQCNDNCFQVEPEFSPTKRIVRLRPPVVKPVVKSVLKPVVKPVVNRTMMKRTHVHNSPKVKSKILKICRPVEPKVQEIAPRVRTPDNPEYQYFGRIRMQPAEPGPVLTLTNTKFPFGLRVPMSILDHTDFNRCLKSHELTQEGIVVLSTCVKFKRVPPGFVVWAESFWLGSAGWTDLFTGRCSVRYCRKYWTNFDEIHTCRPKPESYVEQPQSAYYREQAREQEDTRVWEETNPSTQKNSYWENFAQSTNNYHSGYAAKENNSNWNPTRPIVYGYH